MKLLKKILIVLAVIIAIPLIVALFLKKDYKVERQIVIAKPTQPVYDYLKYLKNQDQFSKWASMDPAMKKTYRGTDGTVGFVSAWESQSDSVGTGEQEIKGMTEGKRLDYEVRFIKPFESTSLAYLTTNAAADSSTLITWGFEGKMPYPMNLMQLFMDMDEVIGGDLETGLANLKKIMEK